MKNLNLDQALAVLCYIIGTCITLLTGVVISRNTKVFRSFRNSRRFDRLEDNISDLYQQVHQIKNPIPPIQADIDNAARWPTDKENFIDIRKQIESFINEPKNIRGLEMAQRDLSSWLMQVEMESSTHHPSSSSAQRLHMYGTILREIIANMNELAISKKLSQ